jgi:hypothetical protein
MGIIASTVALLSLTLLKRPELADKSLPATLDPRIIENAALKARISELEAQVIERNRKLDALEADNERIRRDRDYWYEIIQLQRMRESPDQRELYRYQQSQLAQQGFAAQTQQLAAWSHCTCVPGRFGVLRGDN